ncbi:hypothetical protein CPB86DRAFT_826506 [Serendipita vermifera]|nr:hypothetical protein CPB86DRAFT_826506 [Serendipita vermifera]
MSTITLKDTSVELSNQDDRFLLDTAHLLLEVSCNGQVVDKFNLSSRESRDGVWEADNPLVLPNVFASLVLLVSREVDGNEHQLLGFVELKGPGFSDGLEKTYEIPLICPENHPVLVLKTKMLSVENTKKVISGIVQQGNRSDIASNIEKIRVDALDAWGEFQSYGKLERLDQAIAGFQSARDMEDASYTALNDSGTL